MDQSKVFQFHSHPILKTCIEVTVYPVKFMGWPHSYFVSARMLLHYSACVQCSYIIYLFLI